MAGDLVKIKPLEWRDAFGTQCAGSIFGFYAIRERGWEHVVHLRGEEISRHASPEKAMVGAQEHHDALVRGALEPTQAAAELTRLRSEKAEKDGALAAIHQFCREQAEEWESDLVETDKNYARACADFVSRKRQALSRVSGGGTK